MLLVEQKKTLYSANLPENYPNNIFNIWRIEVSVSLSIRMLINPLAIEFGSDFLYVGDGIDHFDKDNRQWKRLTGIYQNPWEYTSSASSVTIIFTSDGAGTSEGIRDYVLGRQVLKFHFLISKTWPSSLQKVDTL